MTNGKECTNAKTSLEVFRVRKNSIQFWKNLLKQVKNKFYSRNNWMRPGWQHKLLPNNLVLSVKNPEFKDWRMNLITTLHMSRDSVRKSPRSKPPWRPPPELKTKTSSLLSKTQSLNSSMVSWHGEQKKPLELLMHTLKLSLNLISKRTELQRKLNCKLNQMIWHNNGINSMLNKIFWMLWMI